MIKVFQVFALSFCAVALCATAAIAGPGERTGGWTGVHLSIGAGLGQMTTELRAAPDADLNDPGAAGATASFDGIAANGASLNFSAGVDYQFAPRFVAGAFIDYDVQDLETNVDVSIPGIGVRADGRIEVNRSWAIGGRIGYLPSANTMIFATAGIAQLGSTEAHLSLAIDTFHVDARASVPTLTGAFIGGGFETRLTDHISLRGEYRYADFGSGDVTLPTVDGTDLNDFVSLRAAPALHTERVSVVYRF